MTRGGKDRMREGILSTLGDQCHKGSKLNLKVFVNMVTKIPKISVY